MLDADPRVIKDPPAVIEVTGISETYVEVAIRPWVARDDYLAVKGDIGFWTQALATDPDAVLPPTPSIGRGTAAPGERSGQIPTQGATPCPQGDKSKYTDKQERKADHIADSYKDRGVPEKEAERRAWATVNKDDGGGKQPGGSGRGEHTGHPAAHKGGKAGGKAAASRTAAERSASAKKAAATRKRNAEAHAHH